MSLALRLDGQNRAAQAAQDQKSAFDEAYPLVAAWLNRYTGSFEVYCSIRNWYLRYGSLSEKQRAVIERAIEREKQSAPSASSPFKAGTVFLVRPWIAREAYQTQKMDEKGIERPWRNWEIVTLHGETPKAIRATVRFVSTVCERCHICGQELTDEISRATGIGPTCARSVGIKRSTKKTAQEILAELDAIAETVGPFGPIWIAKSQIEAIQGAKRFRGGTGFHDTQEEADRAQAAWQAQQSQEESY